MKTCLIPIMLLLMSEGVCVSSEIIIPGMCCYIMLWFCLVSYQVFFEIYISVVYVVHSLCAL
jgi:hypothetical protein